MPDECQWSEVDVDNQPKQLDGPKFPYFLYAHPSRGLPGNANLPAGDSAIQSGQRSGDRESGDESPHSKNVGAPTFWE